MKILLFIFVYVDDLSQDPAGGYSKGGGKEGNNIIDPEKGLPDVVACMCFDHSDFCDFDTGACFDCQHNTKVPHVVCALFQ